MPLPKDQAWFPAKTYGYGWGLPGRWQGWAVMFGFLASLILGAIFLISVHVILYIAWVVFSSGVLTAICYSKGETPGWRDGPQDDGGKSP